MITDVKNRWEYLAFTLCAVFASSVFAIPIIMTVIGQPLFGLAPQFTLTFSGLLYGYVVYKLIRRLHSKDKRFSMMSQALELVDTSIVVFNKDRKVIFFNEAAARKYQARGVRIRLGGTEQALFQACADRMFNHPKDAKQWYNFTMNHREEQCASGEPFIARINNSDRYDQLILARQPDGNVFEVRSDVTVVKRQELVLANREKELEISRNEAQASNRAKSEFLANMSHEIRTPMNGVIGMTELLMESGLNTEQKNYAGVISKSATALLTLINDILDFSKIEAGKFELSSEPFDLETAIEDIAALLSTSRQARDLELIIDYPAELPTSFVGDGGRMRQVLTNLIGNAVKFTPEGYVAIKVAGDIDGQNAKLRLSIQDTGIGIPSDKLDSVFSAFEQVDGAATRRFEGTGLGLAISQRLAKLMGGEISVESTEGEGSVFSIDLELPIDDSGVSLKQPVRPVALTGKRVLLVDDLELNLEILSKRLSLWGMIPTLVSDASRAIELSLEYENKSKGFELVILDYQMPDLDGHRLCQLFKGHDQLKHIPVLLLSSVDQAVQGYHLNDLGFSGCLLKPVRNQALLQLVSATFSPSESEALPADDSDNDAASALIESELSNIVSDTTILIVEDNPMNQLVVSGFLKKYQFNLEIADNGELGLEAYKDKQPDLVFMDVSMPVMNGMEATTAIRHYESNNGLSRCPIIALTANAMQEDREMCIMAGMDDFLTKPVLSKQLESVILQWLESSVDAKAA